MSKHQKKTKGTKQRADPLALHKGVSLTDSSPFKLEQPHVVSSGPGHVVVRGTTFWETAKSQNNVGDVCTWTYLRPNIGGDTWLKRLSGLYDKYRFNSATVNYHPIVARTTPGALIMSYDVDPADYLPSGSEALVEASSHRTNVFTQVGDRVAMKLKLDMKVPYFYCHESVDEESLDVRFQSQGWICVNQVSAVDPETPQLTYGVLTINYEIEFRDPSIEYVDVIPPGPIPIDVKPPSDSASVNLATLLANVARTAIPDRFPAGTPRAQQDAWRIPAGTFGDLSSLLKLTAKYTLADKPAVGPVDCYFWWEVVYRDTPSTYARSVGIWKSAPHFGSDSNEISHPALKQSTPAYTVSDGFYVEVSELLCARIRNTLTTDIFVSAFFLSNGAGTSPEISAQTSPFTNNLAIYDPPIEGFLVGSTSTSLGTETVLSGGSPISLDVKAGIPVRILPVGKAASAPPLYTDPVVKTPCLVLPKTR